jgi:hypothetical protein
MKIAQAASFSRCLREADAPRPLTFCSLLNVFAKISHGIVAAIWKKQLTGILENILMLEPSTT